MATRRSFLQTGTSLGLALRFRRPLFAQSTPTPLQEFGYTDVHLSSGLARMQFEQTQTVLKGVEAKTQHLNENILPADIKVKPDRKPEDWDIAGCLRRERIWAAGMTKSLRSRPPPAAMATLLGIALVNGSPLSLADMRSPAIPASAPK